MKRVLALTMALSCTLAPSTHAGDGIDVMTLNQYLGANLDAIVSAENPAEMNQAVLAALEQIAQNDFQTRAGLLARLIADRGPHLVGVLCENSAEVRLPRNRVPKPAGGRPDSSSWLNRTGQMRHYYTP